MSEADTPPPGYAHAVVVREEPFPQVRLLEEPTVRLFGRDLPRATGAERLAWCVLLVGVLTVLSIAIRLSPDPRGIGTHEQIPFFGSHLQPCGFAIVTGLPCPSCGYTTTFALAAHGRLISAAKNQPFGFLVFLAAVGAVPISLGAAVGKVSWARVTDSWPWKRIVLVTVLLWLVAWTYKIEMMTAS